MTALYIVAEVNAEDVTSSSLSEQAVRENKVKVNKTNNAKLLVNRCFLFAPSLNTSKKKARQHILEIRFKIIFRRIKT